MYAGREYGVHKAFQGKKTYGVSTEEIEMYFIDVQKLRQLEGYVLLVFQTFKEEETKLFDKYYGSTYQDDEGVYRWAEGVTEVIYIYIYIYILFRVSR